MEVIRKKYVIGIDPGKNTGFAVWNRNIKQLLVVESVLIHVALLRVLEIRDECEVIFEDAREARRPGKNAGRGYAVYQGVGSIKRDSTIWEDFLIYYSIPYKAVAPQADLKKWDSKKFRLITKWIKQTNQHARDAGALVYGL